MNESLASCFWRHAGGAAPASATLTAALAAELDAVLAELIATARAAWPTIALSDEAFVSRLAALYCDDGRDDGRDDRHAVARADAPGETPMTSWLRRVCASELYLTSACATGNREAIAAFDSHFIARVQKHLVQLRPSPAFVDEVRQQLREKLFVAQNGQPLKVAEYAGSGPLENGWLRVVALRLAVDLLRRRELPHAGDGNHEERADSRAGNPELGYVRKEYRALFQACLDEAVRALPAEQRNLLRMHVVDGVTLEELARFFRLSRATVVRRLAAARAVVVGAMRARVQARLSLAADEFESLMGELVSQLDLSLSTVL